MNEIEIILDTETTGLDPKSGHRVVEIGALKMVNKNVVDERFHCYINPQRDMPNEAYRVHGISSDFLQDKPLFSEISADFLEFIEGGRLVIHNARFDVKFLNFELGKVGGGPLINLDSVIDTLQIARRKFPGSRVNLDALCNRFKIDNSDRSYHGALKDAKLLASVYVELMGGLQENFSIYPPSPAKTNKVATASSPLAPTLQERKFKVISPSEDETLMRGKLMEKIIGGKT